MTRNDVFVRLENEPRQSKITDMSCEIIVEKNVARLQITVDDWSSALVVKIIQSRGHIDGDVQSLQEAQRFELHVLVVWVQPRVQVAVYHELVYQGFEVITMGVDARTSSQDLNKVTMPNAAECFAFGQEALESSFLLEIQNLDGHNFSVGAKSSSVHIAKTT